MKKLLLPGLLNSNSHGNGHTVHEVVACAQMEKLIDIMEEDDDVQNIWHNWEE